MHQSNEHRKGNQIEQIEEAKDQIKDHLNYENNENQLIHSNRTLNQMNGREKMNMSSRKELINYIERIKFRNDADHSLMSINSATRESNGDYQCVVSNSIGTTYSDRVAVDVKCK